MNYLLSFPGFGFSFDGDGKTIRARLKDAFERRNPFQRSNFFKIIEQRGDWLKIGIFFFKSLVRSFLEEKISIDVYEGKKNRADS